MDTIIKNSPSGQKSLILTFEGELHFGPYLFSVKPKGFSVNAPIEIIGDRPWFLSYLSYSKASD